MVSGITITINEIKDMKVIKSYENRGIFKIEDFKIFLDH